MSNLRLAHDTLLIAQNKEDLHQLLDIVEEESRKKGLEMNSKEAEEMVVSQNRQTSLLTGLK